MLATGTKLGPFVVTALLGKGGMGAVYRAEDASGRAVALKVLIGELSKDPRYVERFRREAQAAEAVVHRNVVACVGSGDDAGTLWIAFELVGGGTLKELVRARQRLPWPEAAKLGAQVARGLAAIHAKGLVHRDMKPANVLLDEQGVAKVGDLGLARGLAGKQTLTMSGELVGTFEYVAPEQTEHAKVDFRADLYSFGAMLYELVTGRPPFLGAGMALIAQHISAVATAPRELVKELPDELDALIRRLLSKQPEVRGESALAVAAELDEIARRPSSARKLARGLAAAGAGVLVCASLAILASRMRTPPVDPRGPEVAAPATASVAGEPPRKRRLESLPPMNATTVPPPWYVARPASEKPAALPSDLLYGLEDGEYWNKTDHSVLVYAPAAVFPMGTLEDRNEKNELISPVHTATVSGFFVGKHEVTNQQYAYFCEETDGRPATTPGIVRAKKGIPWVPAGRASWRQPHGDESNAVPSHPVVQVSWADAVAYATWAHLKLPTEAQWERAASWDHRQGVKWDFAYGPGRLAPEEVYANCASAELLRAGYETKTSMGDDGFLFTAPAGSFPRFASPVGALDMMGNVSEWCEDVYDYDFYRDAASAETDPVCRGERRQWVYRGGSWCTLAGEARTTKRANWGEDGGHVCSDLGFRVARGER